MKIKGWIMLLAAVMLTTSAAAEDVRSEWKPLEDSTAFIGFRCWLYEAAEGIIRGDVPGYSGPELPAAESGLFVTIRYRGRVRGCYGSFYPSGSTDEVIREYLHGALRCDPRYEPLKLEELSDSEIIITVAERPVPVRDLSSVNIKTFGVVFQGTSGTSTVYVPAEIKTHEYLEKISPRTGDSSIYAFRAFTLIIKKGKEEL